MLDQATVGEWSKLAASGGPAYLTPQQVRAARRMLGWSAVRLAAACELHNDFVFVYERTGHAATSLSTHDETADQRLDKLRRTLEGAGLDFSSDNGDGTAIRRRSRVSLIGEAARDEG